MAKTEFPCPYCGKPLSSPDKLAWHLSRECPAWTPDRRPPARPPQPPDPKERPR